MPVHWIAYFRSVPSLKESLFVSLDDSYIFIPLVVGVGVVRKNSSPDGKMETTLLHCRLTVTTISCGMFHYRQKRVPDKVNMAIYYSTIASFYHILSRERAKYETVVHFSVPV